MVILINYSGLIIGFRVLSIVGDHFGRKIILVAGLICGIGGLLLAIFINNIYAASVGLLIALLGIQWSYSISSMYITEIVD